MSDPYEPSITVTGGYPNPSAYGRSRYSSRRRNEEDDTTTVNAIEERKKLAMKRESANREERLAKEAAARQDLAERKFELSQQRQEAELRRKEQEAKDEEWTAGMRKESFAADIHEKSGGATKREIVESPYSGKPYEVKRIVRDAEGNPLFRNEPLDVESKDPSESLAAEKMDESGNVLRGYRTSRGETNYVDPRNYDATYGEGVPPAMRARVRASDGKVMMRSFGTSSEEEFTGDSQRPEILLAREKAKKQSEDAAMARERGQASGEIRTSRINRAATEKLLSQAETAIAAKEEEAKKMLGGKDYTDPRTFTQIDTDTATKFAPLKEQLDKLKKARDQFSEDIQRDDARQSAIMEDLQEPQGAKKKTSVKVPGDR